MLPSLIIVLIFIGSCFCDVVQTKSGPLRGKSSKDGRVNAFLGIPYAEPPLADLRFNRPIPKKPWTDVYNATENPGPCVQPYFGDLEFMPKLEHMSEDCLFLNIWSPSSADEPMPVIVFIYGGGFMAGGINMSVYDGTNLADYGQIVLATIQYRVGSLGFFTSFTDDAEGNAGLHDQILAVKWIKENAASFGGDPNNIVLMGESAGAFSISALLMSPMTEGLFDKAIIQSGSAILPYLSDNNQRLSKISQKVAVLSGCLHRNESLSTNVTKAMQCLKHLPAEKIGEADYYLVRRALLYTPRVGDELIPEDPNHAFAKGKFKNVKVLMGTNRDEGTMFISISLPNFSDLYGQNIPQSVTEIMARQFIHTAYKLLLIPQAAKYSDLSVRRVTNKTSVMYVKALAEAVGDFLISCPTFFLAELISLMDVPVYYYLYDYRSSRTPFADWMGIIHAAELEYIFGNAFFGNFTQEDMQHSKLLMDRWLAFAKTGNPNIPGRREWPLYHPYLPEYLTIGKEESLNIYPFNNRCDMWREYFKTTIDPVVLDKFKFLTSSLSPSDGEE